MAIKKLMLAIAFGMLATLLLALPAMAARGWCARDPIVSLNGTEVQIWIAVPQDVMSLVNGPVDVVVRTPARVERSLVFTDEGFNGHGETVTFTNGPARIDAMGSFSTDITVVVPLDLDRVLQETGSLHIPVQVTIIVDGQEQVIEGWSTGITTSMQVQGRDAS